LGITGLYSYEDMSQDGDSTSVKNEPSFSDFFSACCTSLIPFCELGFVVGDPTPPWPIPQKFVPSSLIISWPNCLGHATLLTRPLIGNSFGS
jgi:hypothetical protein